MPEIQAFRALRYDLGHVGSLSEVIAPPYDVISPELQDELYRKHPANVVRLILNRIEPGDDDATNNRYTRARRFLKDWQSEGVLAPEPDPAVYVYHQQYTHEGTTYNRRGFMARMRLSRFGEGLVFPHEETMPGPKMDRMMLMSVCRANLSQVFGLYPDPDGQAQEILEQAIAGMTPIEAVDHLGVVNRVWPVTDVSVISALAGAMGPKPVFIADGHHRYETACEYRQHVYESGHLAPDHPANFVLMMFVAMEDPGLVVLPTHRLFRGLPAMTAGELTAKLGQYFTTRPGTVPIFGQGEGSAAQSGSARKWDCPPSATGPQAAPAVWEEIEMEGSQETLGLFTQKDQQWLLVTLTDAGRARMAEIAKDHTDQWRGLGVSILHRLVIEDLLGGHDLPKPKYVHLVREVVEGLGTGEFPLAALVMPATVGHIRTISSSGERMPAKSTYFYPKLLTGLVINPLE